MKNTSHRPRFTAPASSFVAPAASSSVAHASSSVVAPASSGAPATAADATQVTYLHLSPMYAKYSHSSTAVALHRLYFVLVRRHSLVIN